MDNAQLFVRESDTQWPGLDIHPTCTPVPVLTDPPAPGSYLEPPSPDASPARLGAHAAKLARERCARAHLAGAMEWGQGLPVNPPQSAQDVHAAASRAPRDRRGRAVNILRSSVHTGVPAPSAAACYGGVTNVQIPRSRGARDAFASSAAPYAAALTTSIAEYRRSGEDGALISTVIELQLQPHIMLDGVSSQRGGGSAGQKKTRAALEAARIARNATQQLEAKNGDLAAVTAVITKLSIELEPTPMNAPAPPPPAPPTPHGAAPAPIHGSPERQATADKVSPRPDLPRNARRVLSHLNARQLQKAIQAAAPSLEVADASDPDVKETLLKLHPEGAPWIPGDDDKRPRPKFTVAPDKVRAFIRSQATLGSAGGPSGWTLIRTPRPGYQEQRRPGRPYRPIPTSRRR
jgi:hypothetical protein